MRTRKQIRHRFFDYTSSASYFVTINAVHGRMLFGSIESGLLRLNENGSVVQQEWLRLERCFPNVTLDAFVVMPTHFHGIIKIERTNRNPTRRGLQSGSLGSMIGQFKSRVVKRLRRFHNDPTLEIWHRNYYERIIRDDAALHSIRYYIAANPRRWYARTVGFG